MKRIAKFLAYVGPGALILLLSGSIHWLIAAILSIIYGGAVSYLSTKNMNYYGIVGIAVAGFVLTHSAEIILNAPMGTIMAYGVAKGLFLGVASGIIIGAILLAILVIPMIIVEMREPLLPNVPTI